MRYLWGILLVAACFSPHAATGVRCGETGACPIGLVCSPSSGTCELTAIDAAVSVPDDADVDAPLDAYIPPIDGCVPTPEICGDGIDQDCNGSDAVCPPNDLPPGAIDITAGGSFTGQLDAAHANDSPHGCGHFGGRDVFYKITLVDPSVYYLDTFGSDFDTVIRVYPGTACGTAVSGNATCSDDACGSTHSQLAVAIPAGTSCVVVAQANSSETTGNIALHVVKTGHTGTPLPAFANNTASAATTTTCGVATITQTTCSDSGPAGPSLDYYFTTCPGMHKVDVSDCDATWDSIDYLKTATYADVTCNDDSTDNTGAQCTTNASNASYIDSAAGNGPALYWAGVGGFGATDCGSFTLTVTLH